MAPILDAANEIVTAINEIEALSLNAERVYIHQERMGTLSDDIQTWVQPVSHEVETASRKQNQNNYEIDVVLIRKCLTDALIDEMIDVSYDLYTELKRYDCLGDYRMQIINMPTLYSPDYLEEKNLFACVLTVTLIGIS